MLLAQSVREGVGRWLSIGPLADCPNFFQSRVFCSHFVFFHTSHPNTCTTYRYRAVEPRGH